MCFLYDFYLMVKSDTTLVNKKEFENWYANEHRSEAKKALMAKNAKRDWKNKFRLAIYECENYGC